MTSANVAFLAAGAVALLIGGTALLRPALARRVLGMRAGDAATYVLRIGGAMIAAFGLALIVLTLSFVTTEPAR